LPRRVVADDGAAGREHAAAVLLQPQLERFTLVAAVHVLAVDLEDRTQPQARGLLDELVELEEGDLESVRERASDRALPGAAQSEQRDAEFRRVPHVHVAQLAQRHLQCARERDELEQREVRVAALRHGEVAAREVGTASELAGREAFVLSGLGESAADLDQHSFRSHEGIILPALAQHKAI
jgi:hypothetical protein